jgi:hypothetical protein
MGYSDKYGHVTTERHGRTGPIGDEEPVAIFRAQDQLSVPILLHYRRVCIENGCAQDHISSVTQQIENFRTWQGANPTRRPGDNPQ